MWEQIRSNQIRSAILVTGMALILLLLGFFIGLAIGSWIAGLIIALIIWGIMTLVAFFQGDSILLSMARAKKISPAERAKLEGALGGALSRLMAVVEAYPDLKANQSFLVLQEQLTSTENNISTFRQAYNDSVLNLNNKIQMFPSNIVAGITGFKAAELFKVETPEEKEPVQVKF